MASAVFETRRSLGLAASIAEEETAVAPAAAMPGSVSLYNSTGIIPAGTPLILNEDGTVSAVTGGIVTGSSLDMSISKNGQMRAVKVRGDYIIVGTRMTSPGKVYVFNKSGELVHEITGPSGSSYLFGWGVDVNDDYIAVTDRDADKAYLFNMSDGSLRHTLSRPSSSNNNNPMYSNSVSLLGDKVVIGSYQEKDGYGARMYNCVNGSLIRDYVSTSTTANHPTGGTEYHFGRSVAMNSTKVFITHPGHDIHVFSHSSDSSIATISAGGSGQFLDCDETYLTLSTYAYPSQVAVYDVSTLNLIRTITVPNGIPEFGWGAQISGNYIVVSTYNRGYVYVFDITTGNHLATLESPDGDTTYPGTNFGMANTMGTASVGIGDNGDGSAIVAVSHTNHPDGPKLHLYTVGDISTTNLTADNYIGFAGSEFSYDGALGQVITGGGVVTGLSGLVVDADYYVQNDGSIGTTVTDVFAGTATSPTTLELPSPTSWYGDRGIAVFGSGGTAIEYFNIPTPSATSTTFGNLTSIRRFPATGSNGTYGVAVAGYNQVLDDIDYFAIATPGNASNFGLTTRNIGYTWGSSDGTTMFYGSGGADGGGVQLEHITIGTSGTATQFISATSSTNFGYGISNANKTLINGLTTTRTQISYFNNLTATIAEDWGDLVVTTHWDRVGASNETYGLYAGGNKGSTWAHQRTNAIDYVAIDTLGQAGSFGTLSETKNNMCTSSNGTLAAFAGGQRSSSTDTRTIEYVNIGTSGTASDWGDLIGIFTEGRPGNGQIAGNAA